MKGISSAFTGRLGTSADIRTSKAGKPWLSVNVAVDGADADGEATVWVRVAVFGDKATDLAPRLAKGTEVYVEGRLTHDLWTSKEGEARAGLSVAATLVAPLAQFKRTLTPGKQAAAAGGDEEPFFDDPLPF